MRGIIVASPSRVKFLLVLAPRRCGGLSCISAFLCLFTSLVSGTTTQLRAQQAGSLDVSFDPGYGVDGDVNALAAQADNKIIVGGQFNHVDGVAADNLARLNADGSLDPTFHAPAVDGMPSYNVATVKVLTVQPDGRILVGGCFGSVGGASHAGLVRLNTDGSVDASFSPVFDRQTGVYHSDSVGVYAMALQTDGKIVAAGSFSLVNGMPRRGVARLNADGTLDTAFDPATPANVYPPQGLSNDAFSLTLGPEGEVYVGGNFRTINGVSRPALARLRTIDGNLDPSFAPVAFNDSASVDALACQADGCLLVAGWFVQPDGKSQAMREDMARFKPDGAADVAFTRAHRNDSYYSSAISSLLVEPLTGSIVVAGSRLYLDDQPTDGVGRYLVGGNVDKSFFSGLDPLAAGGSGPQVTALTSRPDGSVVAGGNFDTVDGRFCKHLASLRGTPSEDCPVAQISVKVPLAIVGSSYNAPPIQSGKFMLTTQVSADGGLAIHYATSGSGTFLVDATAFEADTLAVRAGKRKTKVAVPPNALAYYAVGSGKKFTLKLEAGRGYVVGSKESATVRVVPAVSPKP